MMPNRQPATVAAAAGPPPAATHACPGGCRRQVAQHLLACPACWGRLPFRLRQPVSASYGRDAAGHAQAVTAAAAWYRDHAGVRT